MYCGAALPGGYRGSPPVLLFFCRRFLFQIKRKCRNAESVYHLIIVGREGRSQLSTSRNCYNFISAIADSGQPQGLSLRTVRNRPSDNFLPLSRQRCVEVAAPYKCADKIVRNSRADDIRRYNALFHYSLRGRMISAPTYFERSETNPSVLASPIQLPYRGA